ncbi:hypothetical protein BDD12DRAFT_302437 [Trichophaea hybrida]|nr:hypothetical protein BDD12DRAFT_302437 [Trichophaea hybrida]
MEKNDANVKTILQKQGTKFCSTIFQPTFIKKGWSKDFGNVRIIDELYNQLSGTPRSAEMAYLDKDVNGLKAKILVNKKLSSPNGIKILPKVAQVAMVAEYMKTTEVTKVWKDTSARIWGIFKQVDTSLADQSNTIPASLRTIDWAAGYNKWEKQLLEAATNNMQTYAQQGVKKALKFIQVKEGIKLSPNGDPVSGGTVAGRTFYKTLKGIGEQNFGADLDLKDLYVAR